VKPHDPGQHNRHAGPTTRDARLELDTDGRPSMFTQGQKSAEVQGLTLHTDPFTLRLALQRHLGELDEAHETFRVRWRAKRLQLLTVVTVLLWLATLIVLLARL